jgi:hypothetical protein
VVAVLVVIIDDRMPILAVVHVAVVKVVPVVILMRLLLTIHSIFLLFPNNRKVDLTKT